LIGLDFLLWHFLCAGRQLNGTVGIKTNESLQAAEAELNYRSGGSENAACSHPEIAVLDVG
jgi:hypothetical protein